MNAIFYTVSAAEIKISVDEIQVLTESFRELQRTGLIRLAYDSERYLYLFIKRGKVLNAYLIASESKEPLPLENWVDWMKSAGDAYAKIIPLSSFGVLISKLLIQSENGEKEIFDHPSQLSEYCASCNESPKLSLIQLSWDNAMGAVFFSGVEKLPYSLFVSQEIIHDEAGVNDIFFKWNEPRCTVTTFTPVLSADAWQEYYLRQSFADICNRTLSRFESMTGRALVDSLVRLVSIFASKNNLDINISSRKLIDREVFSSPQEAAQNYRQFLGEMFSHFSVVIGSRLLALTLREIVTSLPEYECEIIRRFELLPEGYFYE